MRTMQAKLLATIEYVIKRASASLEPVQVPGSASNVGHVHAQRGVETVVMFRYQFNDLYCSFTALRGQDWPSEREDKGWPMIEYHDTAKLNEFLTALYKACAGQGRTVPADLVHRAAKAS